MIRAVRDSDIGIGIVAGADLSRHVLNNLLQEAGYRVARCIAPKQLAACLDGETRPHAWLLDTTDADIDELLAQLEAAGDAPLLINDETPPLQRPADFAVWRRRLLEKLEELAAAVNAAPAAPPPAAVWVLAASTGGPAAVDRFMRELAPGLPIALIYAQHIDIGFDRVLTGVLERHGHYDSALVYGEQRLRPGGILVVPADRQLRFLPFHRVVATRKPWAGNYQPAIDPVIASVARLYRRRAGAIIFSGLCDDGATGCRLLHAAGGEVWVQRPDSCVSPDMPNAALATGAVRFQGTPEQLAQALNARYSQTPAATRTKVMA